MHPLHVSLSYDELISPLHMLLDSSQFCPAPLLYRQKSFPYFVPLCWNILIRYLWAISCQETFKAHLKHHLFNNFPLMYLHMLLTLTYDLLPAAPFLVLIITLLVVSSLCLLYYQPITSNWPSFQPTFSTLPLLTYKSGMWYMHK